MKVNLINYPKPRNSDVGDFCELARRAWVEAESVVNNPVLVIQCRADHGEEIDRYLNEHYSGIMWTTVTVAEEDIPKGEVELKPGDLKLAREAVQSSHSATWAIQTVMRYGIPRLRAEKAVREVFVEIGQEQAGDKRGLR